MCIRLPSTNNDPLFSVFLLSSLDLSQVIASGYFHGLIYTLFALTNLLLCPSEQWLLRGPSVIYINIYMPRYVYTYEHPQPHPENDTQLDKNRIYTKKSFHKRWPHQISAPAFSSSRTLTAMPSSTQPKTAPRPSGMASGDPFPKPTSPSIAAT